VDKLRSWLESRIRLQIFAKIQSKINKQLIIHLQIFAKIQFKLNKQLIHSCKTRNTCVGRVHRVSADTHAPWHVEPEPIGIILWPAHNISRFDVLPSPTLPLQIPILRAYHMAAFSWSLQVCHHSMWNLFWDAHHFGSITKLEIKWLPSVHVDN
jgi:hypothetical protein